MDNNFQLSKDVQAVAIHQERGIASNPSGSRSPETKHGKIDGSEVSRRE